MSIRSSPQHFIVVVVLLPYLSYLSSSSREEPPPLPVEPLPTNAQLQWQAGEMVMFLHFGMNTFTDSEWGTGTVDPTVFYPNSLNATQWAEAAKDAGFSRMVLTAKHHDGFCLWPSKYTNYSVENSGIRDVVGDAAAAARDQGIGFGLYLSPWDRHEECYGNSKEYNEFYLGQMSELLERLDL